MRELGVRLVAIPIRRDNMRIIEQQQLRRKVTKTTSLQFQQFVFKEILCLQDYIKVSKTVSHPMKRRFPVQNG